jgi:hypothetical protein
LIVHQQTVDHTFKTSNEFDTGAFYQKIVQSNQPSDTGLVTFTKFPKIAGTYSEWKLSDMIKIDVFYDCLLRNLLPPTRYYVEEKKDMVSKLAKILNNEIYTMFRNQK